MTRTATPPVTGDLTSCDREPIHIPGSIQPFGFLLALDEGGTKALQASENVRELLGRGVEDVLGRPLNDLFGTEQGRWLAEGLANPSLERNVLYLGTVTVRAGGRERSFHTLAHRKDGALILELEATETGGAVSFQDLYALMRTFLARMEHAATTDELARLAAEEARRITGFDRALVYRFDEGWNGTVIAEDRNDVFPALLDHRFPASDIPAQARELYRVNRLRQIADADYRPVPIVPATHPATGRPLDLTFATLRSVSPVHVEYLKNMGTLASMSISILRGDRLWGLISCHNAAPRVVPFQVRTACDFLGQVLSLQLAAKEHQADVEERMGHRATQTKLLAFMANEDPFIDGLTKHPDELLALTRARGAAVVHHGQCSLLGEAPDEAQVDRLVTWLTERVPEAEDVFVTDSLPGALPEAVAYKDRACGLLAVALSKLHRSYLLWFRPELLRTVIWAGDPHKPAEPDGEGEGEDNGPRRSFAMWQETVRLRSDPWRPSEVDAAAELRHAVVGIVLRKVEEMAQLSVDLERSNQELEAFSYSVSHDLRAPFRHIVGYGELLREEDRLSENGRRYVDTIIESARYAGVLVDSLLTFAHMGRAALHPSPVDMNLLLDEARRDVAPEADGRAIRWEVAALPRATCDPMMMRLVLRNLLSNAVKYTRGRDEAVITVGSEDRPEEVVFFVRDNGIGFDMKYVGKLFGVFQRLHRMEDFEGTGIGLANVRRIVERHGGRAWAAGAEGAGATFFFSLPKAKAPVPGQG